MKRENDKRIALKDMLTGKKTVQEVTQPKYMTWFYENGIYESGGKIKMELNEEEFKRYCKEEANQSRHFIVFIPCEGCEPLIDTDEKANN